jgi:TolB-like protein
MNRIVRRLATIMPLCLAVTGCMGDPNRGAISSTALNTPDLGTLTYRAVDIILASSPDVSRNTPLVVASLSDVQNLESSSALGNIVADMIRTRLAQTGHRTSEVRLRAAIDLKQGNGEFLLSRNRASLMSTPNTAAVVTGTYAMSYDRVYVSIKLISATDARIVAGADFVVPLRDVLGLIQQHST